MAEVNREQLLNCALCPNMCRCECPVDRVWRKEAAAPAGKARLAHLLLEEKIPPGEDILETLAACTGCRGCRLLCPFPELDLPEELGAVRLAAVKGGAGLKKVKPYLQNLRKYGSPYGAGKATAAGLKGAEVLFFAGCTVRANNPELRKTALALLERAGLSCSVMEDEYCCGYPAQVWGDEGTARELAAVNRERIAASGAARVVTGCPECRLTFTRRYPEWGLEISLPVVDAASFFLELVREGRLQPQPVSGITAVTYHDPCLRARVEGAPHLLRQLIALLPGLELQDPPRRGEKSRCCGGGQMMQLVFPEKAEAMARRRLAELPEADAVITDCPFCREGLQVGERPVLDPLELLGKACL